MTKFGKIAQAVFAVAAVGLVAAGIVYWPQVKGVLPAIQRPNQDIADIIDDNNQQPPSEQPRVNATEFPLKLPGNTKIEIFARDLPGARVMAFDAAGDMWVSQTNQGKLTKLDIKDGRVDKKEGIYSNLDSPHGIAFDNDGTMYVAEEGRVSVVNPVANPAFRKIADLPATGGHSTRTIEFGPDGRLYVSIGSSCNVCDESDARRAAIYSMNKDGSDFKAYASGLRNSVFFDWSEIDGSMWATENSRDNLGDDVPPDEVNRIVAGGNYGWPICYGKNIHDTNFDKKTYIRNPCMEPFETPSAVDIQAHSAPLGMDFVPEEGWPEDYWYDIIVALHGSWNRTSPTGYKLVRIKLNAKNEYEGTEDFVTGWLQGSNALGRPVDVLVQPGGAMFVSDDKAGVIYKISLIEPSM